MCLCQTPTKGGHIKKIVDLKLRKRLKDILNKLKIQKGMGVIIRTAGESMTIKEIKRDYNSLIKLWKEITTKTIKSNAPSLIHEEDNLIKRCIRDYFDNSFESIIVNNKEILSKCKEILKQFMPQSAKLIKLYKNKKPLFFNYGIEKKIVDINHPVVKLKSGGYLVINQTEALVAIDINSGKFTKNRNIEDTAFQTNLEAAEEISRQIKIRDLAGLVVIDFIDMLDRNHNFKVEKRLKDFLKTDRARIQVGRISNFGLLELSRQRLKVNEDSKISKKCEHCNGYGRNPSSEFLTNQILRVFSEITYDKPKENIFILCNKKLQEKFDQKSNLKVFEKIQKKILSDDELNELDFIICKKNHVYFTNRDKEIDIERINHMIQNKNSFKNLEKNKSPQKRQKVKSDELDITDNVDNFEQETDLSKKEKATDKKLRTLRRMTLKRICPQIILLKKVITV